MLYEELRDGKMTEEEKYVQHVEDTRDALNAVSPSFCVAKWKQVTMHLQNGHTHSCHHPNTHLVPVEELKKNHTALHNTSFKKEQRKSMLEGTRPSECEYCWRAEDAGNISDRTYKSADTWAHEYIETIPKLEWDANVDPSYVEVSFSNVCNFKCSYCSPNISSQWMEEIERYGEYPTSSKFNGLTWLQLNNQIPIPNNQSNPYVDAFWEWFPDMYNELKQFRITGGEPLLSKNTFKILDYIIDNPNTNLTFSINTNMNTPDELYNKFIEKLKIIQSKGNIHRLNIFTSAEASGKQAEYIRYGMNYEKWLTNLNRMITEVPSAGLTIMCTYNILSIPSFKTFLQDILSIRLKYRESAVKHHRVSVDIDIPYLRHPAHQASFIISKDLLHYVEEQLRFMKDNIEPVTSGKEYTGFYPHEIHKLERVYNIIKAEIDYGEDNTTNRKDFVLFVDEHDRRRGTNFLETFPELADTYNNWKKLLK
jgi:organic radical activating enzyme